MSKKSFFIVSGEASGDRIGAWYLSTLKKKNSTLYCEAIGGPLLAEAGAQLYDNYAHLNAVGIVEIVRQLPFFISYAKKLANYIAENGFDEVVLVDFPGFNLYLANLLRKKAPEVTITYCSPPQLWAWGAWRLKKLSARADRIVVIYPFEVEWYRARGVEVEWLGYPGYEKFDHYRTQSVEEQQANKKRSIAIIPGSRKVEIKTLLPLFVDVMRRLKMIYPDLTFVVPCASSFSPDFLAKEFTRLNFRPVSNQVQIVVGEEEQLQALSSCVAALSKPGTMSLHASLLGVPTVIAYKTSFLTYTIAKRLVTVNSMSLTNLISGKKLCPEFIQNDLSTDALVKELKKIYDDYRLKPDFYASYLEELHNFHSFLKR